MVPGVCFNPSEGPPSSEYHVPFGSYIRTLKELSLVGISKEGMEVIASALASSPLSLERLELVAQNPFTDTAADCLAQFIRNSTVYLAVYHLTHIYSVYCTSREITIWHRNWRENLRQLTVGNPTVPSVNRRRRPCRRSHHQVHSSLLHHSWHPPNSALHSLFNRPLLLESTCRP